jgi:hypothetical protein
MIATINGKPLGVSFFFFHILYLSFILATTIDHDEDHEDHNHNDHISTPTPPTPASLRLTPKPVNASKRRWQQQQQGSRHDMSRAAGMFFFSVFRIIFYYSNIYFRLKKDNVSG